MIFVVGGGGSLSNNNAVLLVTIPSGCDITVTKNGLALNPTIWTSESDQSKDIAIFTIASSKFDGTNPWVVTISDGNNSKSIEVLVDENKIYTIEVLFSLWLYYKGNTFDSITGGWRTVPYNANASLTLEPKYININVNSSSGIIATTSTIDITDYKTLYFVFDSLSDLSSTSRAYAALNAYTPAALDAYNNVGRLLPRTQVTENGSNIIVQVDISDAVGNYYVEFAINTNIVGKINEIYLDV